MTKKCDFKKRLTSKVIMTVTKNTYVAFPAFGWIAIKLKLVEPYFIGTKKNKKKINVIAGEDKFINYTKPYNYWKYLQPWNWKQIINS